MFDFIAPEAMSPRLCLHTALRPEARLYGIAGFKTVSCRIDPFGPNRRFLVPCPADMVFQFLAAVIDPNTTGVCGKG